jgi:hypothetical protein
MYVAHELSYSSLLRPRRLDFVALFLDDLDDLESPVISKQCH